MNNRQRAKLDSYNRITNFNTTNQTDIATIAEYALEKGAFDNALASINNAAGTQAMLTGSKITPVDTAKEQMASAVIKLALRGMVKAKQMGEIELANELNEPLTFIMAATKTLAIQRARNLRNVMNDRLFVLTNITSNDIATVDATIASYNDLKDQPIEARQHKKATGTDILPAAYNAADEAVSNMYSLLQSYFSESKPELVNEFSLAMEIIGTGLRHNTVDFIILADETGNTLANAIVTDESNGKSYTTDNDGLAHVGKHRSGNYSFSITATGRQTINFSADIHRGTNNAYTVRLKTV